VKTTDAFQLIPQKLAANLELLIVVSLLASQNRWTNLSRLCKSYQLSDRAGAAISPSTLQDMGIVSK